MWAQSVDPDAAPYTPLSLEPGETGTITLTFTPSGRRGHVVRGFIGLDTFNRVTASGDEVADDPIRVQDPLTPGRRSGRPAPPRAGRPVRRRP